MLGACLGDVILRPCASQTTGRFPSQPFRPYRQDPKAAGVAGKLAVLTPKRLRGSNLGFLSGFSFFYLNMTARQRNFKIVVFPSLKWTVFLRCRSPSTKSIWLWGASWPPSLVLRLQVWLSCPGLFKTQITEAFYTQSNLSPWIWQTLKHI